MTEKTSDKNIHEEDRLQKVSSAKVLNVLVETEKQARANVLLKLFNEHPNRIYL